MTTKTTGIMVHQGMRAAGSTHLPLRTVLGHWTRELGVSNGTAIFPGPRRNPGNVTVAHVGKVCGTLGGFPVFCSATDGVNEYAWYFNNLSYYDNIAAQAAGNWKKACDLIEQSPWSSTHYGGTLDQTAAGLEIRGVKATVALANVRQKPTTLSPIVYKLGGAARLAYDGTTTGQTIGGNSTWLKVRIGSGNGVVAYIHDSVADMILL